MEESDTGTDSEYDERGTERIHGVHDQIHDESDRRGQYDNSQKADKIGPAIQEEAQPRVKGEKTQKETIYPSEIKKVARKKIEAECEKR